MGVPVETTTLSIVPSSLGRRFRKASCLGRRITSSKYVLEAPPSRTRTSGRFWRRRWEGRSTLRIQIRENFSPAHDSGVTRITGLRRETGLPPGLPTHDSGDSETKRHVPDRRTTSKASHTPRYSQP